MSRAAADLYVAQSALSQQLASLEGELAYSCCREALGVLPTQAGTAFYRHAQVVLRQIEHLRTEVLESGESPSGPVSVGVPTSAAIILAGPMIAEIRKRFPGIQLRIIEGMSGHLEEHIINGRVDFGLMFDYFPAHSIHSDHDHGNPKYLDYQPLLVEELTLITRRDNIPEKRLTITELALQELILPTSANITRRIVDNVFDAAGIKPNVIAELDSVDGIISVVGRGLGATVLSRSALSRAAPSDDLVSCPVLDATLSRRMSLCTNNIVALSGAAERVKQFVVDLTVQLVETGVWKGATLLTPESH